MERALINAGQQYKNEKNFTGDQAVLNPSVGISNPFIKEGKEKAQGILLAKSDIEMSSVSQQITSFINIHVGKFEVTSFRHSGLHLETEARR